jgi:hypothetical protein
VASVVLVIVVIGVVWIVVAFVRSRRYGLEAKRGLSIGADLGQLADTPKVTVRTVTTAGTGTVRLVLAAESEADIDVIVSLNEDDFGFGLLREWQRAGTAVAIVMPPDSHIVRLRSVDDLQPLTLRRVDGQ